MVAAAGAAPKRPPAGAGVLAAGLGVPNSPPPEGAAPPNSDGVAPAVLAAAPNPNVGAVLAVGVVPVLAAGAPKAGALLVAAELPKRPPAGAAADAAGCPKRLVLGADEAGGVEAVGEHKVSCCWRKLERREERTCWLMTEAEASAAKVESCRRAGVCQVEARCGRGTARRTHLMR